MSLLLLSSTVLAQVWYSGAGGINTSGERSFKLPCPDLFPVVLPVVGASLLKKTTQLKCNISFPVGIRFRCLCLVTKFSEIVWWHHIPPPLTERWQVSHTFSLNAGTTQRWSRWSCSAFNQEIHLLSNHMQCLFLKFFFGGRKEIFCYFYGSF